MSSFSIELRNKLKNLKKTNSAIQSIIKYKKVYQNGFNFNVQMQKKL